MIRPTNIGGGFLSPTAISIAREQCASICAGRIVPHTRAVSGVTCAIRFFTPSAVAASKRFVIWKDLPS
jgi:hypothetical protein